MEGEENRGELETETVMVFEPKMGFLSETMTFWFVIFLTSVLRTRGEIYIWRRQRERETVCVCVNDEEEMKKEKRNL